MSSNKVVLLMNLGSPDSTSAEDLKTYLNEFLMDERVIDTPKWWRTILVKKLIVPSRAPKSAEKYKSIWKDGSPLILYTEQQAELLRKKTNWNVEICMRYGNPSSANVLEKISRQNVDEVILVPLYPHYAMSSYETAVEQVKEICTTKKYSFKLKTVPVFYNHPEFINAWVANLTSYLKEDYDHILFSYHGIPERHVTKLDPTKSHCLKKDNCCSLNCESAQEVCYRHQVYETTRLVVEKLNIPKEKYSISFQSRLGRAKWLLPNTANVLRELPNKGVKKLVVLCPSFVSDCLETLEEIHDEGKEDFLKSGGEKFVPVPCLNTHEEWIHCIQKLVEEIY